MTYLTLKHTLYTSFVNKNCGLWFLVFLFKNICLTMDPYAYFEACLICGMSFTTKIDLERHTRLIHTTFKVQCDQCGELFPSSRSIGGHMKVHPVVIYNPHPQGAIPPERFQCFLCPSVFATQENCNNHEIIYLHH